MTKGSLGDFRGISVVRVVSMVSTISVVSAVWGVSTVRVVASVWAASATTSLVGLTVSSFLRNPTNKRMKTEKKNLKD